MDIVRTPDERFRDLSGYSFEPHYLEGLKGYEGLRAHYLDEGSGSDIFLCLHGEPTWAYLYRKMLPIFVEGGGRVVAPDFFGFGRSDKPTDDAVYTWGFHREYLLRFVEKLDLTNITLVCQDWGGLLGLTLPMAMPERFSRLLVMNTTLARGKSPGAGFESWKSFVAASPDLDVAGLMGRAVGGISEAELAAYAAPFPDQASKAGVRRFPAIVPVTPEMEGASTSLEAAKWLSESWQGRSFMAVGALDPVLGPPVMEELQSLIKGCPPPMVVAEGGHFVQEHGEGIARAALVHFGKG